MTDFKNKRVTRKQRLIPMANHTYMIFTLFWTSFILGSMCYEDFYRTSNDISEREKLQFRLGKTSTEVDNSKYENYEPSPYRRLHQLLSRFLEQSKYDSIIKRAPDGFMGMRGKRNLQTAFSNNPKMHFINNFSELFNKLDTLKSTSAPLREYLNLPYAINDYVINRNLKYNEIEGNKLKSQFRTADLKRAPIGFTGMRGKRPVSKQTTTANKENETSSMLFKTLNLFDNKFNHETFKRSTEEVLDANNKKQRNLLRNKFVAVRGKKYFEQTDSNMGSNVFEGQFPVQRNALASMPRAYLLDSYDKRTPSGFQGMRGKRISFKDSQT